MTIQAVVTHSPFVVQRRTSGDSYDLIARQETMSQTLLIPGLSRLNPNKLFANGQPGGWADPYDLTRMWVDDAGTTPATIASLGTGIGRVITKGNAITLTQSNAADRPVWGRHPVSGIRNLASGTDLTVGAVSGTPGTPPTGWSAISTGGAITVTSQGLRLVTTDNSQRSFQQSISLLANTTYSISIIADISTPVGIHNTFLVFSGLPAGATVTRFQDGASLAEFQNLSVATNSVIRLNIAVGATPGTINVQFGTRVSSAGGSGNDITFRNFQAEVGTTRSTYQSATNRFDITETGVPSLYYFSGNGVNQRWSSNATVNFSGVDKVTVWAGAQRLSNAARGTIVELTSSIASNNGAFHLTGPNAVSDTFGWESKGTTLRDAVATVALGSPRRLVGVGDISGDLSRLIVDGTATDNTGDQGTGNYSNATLHVFSRGGSSQFFNGRLYSLIIAGGLYDSRTIARFADWTTKPRRLITA